MLVDNTPASYLDHNPLSSFSLAHSVLWLERGGSRVVTHLPCALREPYISKILQS